MSHYLDLDICGNIGCKSCTSKGVYTSGDRIAEQALPAGNQRRVLAANLLKWPLSDSHSSLRWLHNVGHVQWWHFSSCHYSVLALLSLLFSMVVLLSWHNLVVELLTWQWWNCCVGVIRWWHTWVFIIWKWDFRFVHNEVGPPLSGNYSVMAPVGWHYLVVAPLSWQYLIVSLLR